MNVTDPPKVARSEAAPMPAPARAKRGGPPGVPVHPLLWALVLVIVLMEVLPQLAALGLAPAVFDRAHVFATFAFFDVEWENMMAGNGWSPHLLWSLVTHAFLHGGAVHLLMNMAAFLALGHAIVQAIGFPRFFVTFLVCSAAGAVALGVLSQVGGPLVGASGAVFGFLGMITCWQERMLARRGAPRTAIWQRILGLIAINAALVLALGGLLAWEAHLGGFVAGWILALVWPPRKATRLPF